MKKLFSLVAFLALCTFWASARTDVTNQYLQNADLSSLTGWNYGDGGYDYTDWKNDGDVPVVEFYYEWGENPGAAIGSTRNFHFTQNVTLPAGNYRLVANAFYREGAGDGTSKTVLVAGTKQKNIMGLKDGDLNFFSGSSDLYRAANAFSLGYYVNYIDFTIDAEQEVTLGISGYIDTYQSWCVLGGVKLYQYANEEEKEDEAGSDLILPQPKTLESGKTYYLYNIGSDKYIYHRNSSYVEADATKKTGVTIKDNGDGTYTMQFSDNNRYIYTSSNYMYTQSGVDANVYFRFAEVEGGYTIQRNRNYDATNYVANNSNEKVYADQTSGNIVWRLYDVEEFDYYYAKKALHDALEAAVGYEFATSDYLAIYENEASTAAELNAAAAALNKRLNMSRGYKAPWWNERPILFYTADGNFGQSYYDTWALPDNNYTIGTYFRRYVDSGSSSISATVMVEEPSTLVYGTDGGGGWIRVSVDGTEVRALNNVQFRTYPSDKTHTRFFEELEPGLHTITWTVSTSNGTFLLYDVGVISKPQISVNLLEPGSLGTEVLYNTDHIKNVRRLKVKGAMNSDDWAKIKMMSTLLELDLGEAQFTEIPADQFKVSYNDTTMNFLHKVVLPEGLTTIGDKAFRESFVEEINLPSTMRRVGREAFYRSHVKELIMPDDMTDFYGGSNSGYCFGYMYWLERLVLPNNLTRIPNETFYEGYYITEAVMPEKLQTVGENAFRGCQRMQTTLPEGLRTIEYGGFFDCYTLNSPLPSTLTTIGADAFRYNHGYTSLVIPESVTSIGDGAFIGCSNLTMVELGVNQYSLANRVFQDCGKLTTVKLKSPTVTNMNNSSSSYYPLSDITKVVLQVPHYLVNSYKLHSYWYNAKAIEPFDYSDVTYIPIHDNLTLNHERFGGQPSVDVFVNGYLKINGDAAQQFTNVYACTEYNGSNRYFGQLLNNCDQITASGDNMLSYRTDAKKWYFISLPFDLDLSRIYPDGNAQYAIRYYDGAGRAANGKSGNWKNVDLTGVIPAGTGFIYQTNVATWTHFLAADTENKYGTLRTTEFNKTLEVNASETASNRGWNLVGNPYQCFYNNHCLNFTAPITIWNVSNSTYTAYSLTDDDYAICPNEAFFVQCPNEEYKTLGFPLQGRQLTSVIENQNAAREVVSQAGSRQVINLTVSNGEMEDMTRVVLNEQANTTYEVNCDASKFMSMDNSVPQIYSLDADGTQYAINERPLGDGSVALGFYAGQSGAYTITLSRCDAEKVYLTDNHTGETVDITYGEYAFSAEAGTDNTRFSLSFASDEVTGIQEIGTTAANERKEVFSVDGKFLGTETGNLGKGVYIIRQGKKVSKVIVR